MDHLELALADFAKEAAMHTVDQSIPDYEEYKPYDQNDNSEEETSQ